MQSIMESPTSGINEAEERISDIEDKITENGETEQKREIITGPWGGGFKSSVRP